MKRIGMKRLSVLVACIMALFALAACSNAVPTLEEIREQDSEYAAKVEAYEQELLDESVSAVDVEFQDNTVTMDMTFSYDLVEAGVDAAELEESLMGDAGLEKSIAELVDGTEVNAEDVTVKVIIRNPDGSEFANFEI